MKFVNVFMLIMIVQIFAFSTIFLVFTYDRGEIKSNDNNNSYANIQISSSNMFSVEYQSDNVQNITSHDQNTPFEINITSTTNFLIRTSTPVYILIFTNNNLYRHTFSTGNQVYFIWII